MEQACEHNEASSRRGVLICAVCPLAVVMLAGKFGLESNPMLYAGVVLLVAAAVWNALPTADKIAKPWCASL